MKIVRSLVMICMSYFVCTHNLFAYDLPFVNLGLTNFWDGGPVRPAPGWYYFQYLSYYYSNKFLDAQGNLLTTVKPPAVSACATIFSAAYQSKDDLFLNAAVGIDASIPLAFQAKLNCNSINILSSGAGFGDLSVGAYLQWKPSFYSNGDPFFVHRLAFDVSIPTGKYKEPKYFLNPGNGFWFIDTYWAATLFINPNYSFSWRIYYLWNFTQKKTKVRAGQALFFNYGIECHMKYGLHVGVNGYFLQQLQSSTQCGIEVPNSRERVFAIGPGLFYEFSKDLYLFGHLYFESDVRNRPQGINSNVSVVVHF